MQESSRPGSSGHGEVGRGEEDREAGTWLEQENQRSGNACVLAERWRQLGEGILTGGRGRGRSDRQGAPFPL